MSSTPAINDVLGVFYSDYFTLTSMTVSGEFTIDEFVSLKGSFSFGISLQTVTVATGLPANATDLLGSFGSTFTDVDMLTLTIGAAGVHAFVGLGREQLEGENEGIGTINILESHGFPRM